ncbi:MAG: hypothetical protein K1W14_02965 [Muribaculaceae bacterium]
MTGNNIICFEGEWEFNSQKKDNKFNLNSGALLQWLKDFHGCSVIHRHVLSKADLEHYMKHMANSRSFKNHNIIYFSCHGWEHSIALEGEDGNIDLKELAEMAENAKNFFEGKILHFSACYTFADGKAVEDFKKKTGARLACGYTKSVDAMKSSIADMALFNELMYIKNKFGIITNQGKSTFRNFYKSMLDNLGFEAY